MKQFLKHIILFSIPLWLVVLFVWIVDPVNYFGQNDIISPKYKDEVFADANSNMIKLGAKKKILLSKTDATSLLLGDSRVMPIDVNDWNTETQYRAFNFAFAGCYTRSAIASFFYAIEHIPNKPSVVYLGHNFWGLSDPERFSDIDDIGSSPLKYVTSPLTWTLIKDIVLKVYDKHITHNEVKHGSPTITIQEGWNEIISRKQHEVTIEHIQVQPIIYDLIDSISHYCERHDIRLIHVYPPEYKDLLAIIQSDSITNAEYQKYLDHLSQYEFYNFNQGHWIESSNDFVDPMHPKSHVYNNMIDSIFGD